jgi:broad specificity phosphatase PhoE
MATKLLLIRHGQTSWNARKIYCGARDIGLNAKGKKQAERLCRQLDQEVIHEVYSSDKKRAVQTARIIFKKNKINRLAGLREMHFGVFEGLSHAQVLGKYPGIYSQWLKDPFSITMPKGESLRDFRKRVIIAMKKIAQAHPKQKVAVVCHGGVIGIFLSHLLKRKKFWSLIPKPATCTIINYPVKNIRDVT